MTGKEVPGFMTTVNIYQIPAIYWLNNVSQFLDAWIFLYFLTRFFDEKKEQYARPLWITGASVLWGLLIIVSDTLTANNYYFYSALMLLVPICYALLFFRGPVMLRILVPVYYFMILRYLEQAVVVLMCSLEARGGMQQKEYIFWFIIRRYGTKLILFWFCHMMLKRDLHSYDHVPNFYWWSMVLICVLGNVVFEMSRLESVLEISLRGTVVILSFAAIQICVFLLMNLLLKQEEENRVNLAIIRQAQIQSQYNTQMTDLSDSLKKFRHDWKQHLFCMDSLLMNQEYEELHKYMMNLHQMGDMGSQLVEYTPNVSLNAILNQKRALALKMGIRFTANVFLQEIGKLSQQDLNVVVFNLLDNALEAAVHTESGFVCVEIHNVRAYLQIEVTNSVAENVKKTNPLLQTSKKDKEIHGLGLKTVKCIVERNDGVYETSGDDHTFTTKVLLLDA